MSRRRVLIAGLGFSLLLFGLLAWAAVAESGWRWDWAMVAIPIFALILILFAWLE